MNNEQKLHQLLIEARSELDIGCHGELITNINAALAATAAPDESAPLPTIFHSADDLVAVLEAETDEAKEAAIRNAVLEEAADAVLYMTQVPVEHRANPCHDMQRRANLGVHIVAAIRALKSSPSPAAREDVAPAELRHAFMTLESDGNGDNSRRIVLKFNQKGDAYAVFDFLLKGCGQNSRCGAAPDSARDAGALAIAATINKKLGDVIAGRMYLLPADLAALQRFHECAMDFDSGGHDVSKETMARLREIGVVESKGFGRHQVTSFGSYVLGRIAGEDVRIPLKTCAEYNEESRLATAAKSDEKGKA